MAALTVSVEDVTTAGDKLAALDLQLEQERTTVREMVRARVHQEVREFNAARAGPRFHGLVQPTEAETALNGGRAVAPAVDAEQQLATALSAFERGHVLVLIDGRQVEQLDDEVRLRPGSSVSFVRLVPLVGG